MEERSRLTEELSKTHKVFVETGTRNAEETMSLRHHPSNQELPRDRCGQKNLPLETMWRASRIAIGVSVPTRIGQPYIVQELIPGDDNQLYTEGNK